MPAPAAAEGQSPRVWQVQPETGTSCQRVARLLELPIDHCQQMIAPTLLGIPRTPRSSSASLSRALGGVDPISVWPDSERRRRGAVPCLLAWRYRRIDTSLLGAAEDTLDRVII